ncbi:MAG: HEAT repeat domain-containing protein, partial [Anaerolineae bacterium]|nr:HEAT repeat domain-containing protein [Anaerolineae bacterium]
PRALESLINALRDGGPTGRSAAARALGQISDPRAIESLIVALLDTDSFVRQSAANALRAIGTPEAFEAVRDYKAGEL